MVGPYSNNAVMPACKGGGPPVRAAPPYRCAESGDIRPIQLVRDYSSG